MGVQSGREKKRVVVVGGVLGVTHVGCVICPRCGSAEKERTRSRCEAGAAFVTPYSSSSPQAHTPHSVSVLRLPIMHCKTKKTVTASRILLHLE